MTDTLFKVTQNSEPLVTIHADRTMTFGENYEPDAAAKCFWDAVFARYPHWPMADEIGRLRAENAELRRRLDEKENSR